MAISDEELARSKKLSVEQVRLLRRTRGATNDTLSGLPATAVRRAIRRLNYPDLPRARQAFRAAQHAATTGASRRTPSAGPCRSCARCAPPRPPGRRASRACQPNAPWNRAG